MKIVIQRVLEASVVVDSPFYRTEIGPGLLILVGVEKADSTMEAGWLAEKTLHLRIFADETGKMNRSILEARGHLLAISQFTLTADCTKGRRPSFERAEISERAKPIYEFFCRALETGGAQEVKQGVFGADMKVGLVNDGPVTFILEKRPISKTKIERR